MNTQALLFESMPDGASLPSQAQTRSGVVFDGGLITLALIPSKMSLSHRTITATAAIKRRAITNCWPLTKR